MARPTVVAALVGALWVGPHVSASAEDPKTFHVRLSVMPVDDSARFVGQTTITGAGSARATLKGHELTIAGAFKGMQSGATVARLRWGPRSGMRGPVIADLEVAGSSSGTVRGMVRLSQEQVMALEKGRLYLQIDAEQAPAGNLWGWLIPSAGLPEDPL